MTMTKREQIIGTLEGMQCRGEFVGHPEEVMDFHELPDEELEWYSEHWFEVVEEEE